MIDHEGQRPDMDSGLVLEEEPTGIARPTYIYLAIVKFNRT